MNAKPTRLRRRVARRHRLRATAQLVRWLGPFGSDAQKPRNVARETLQLSRPGDGQTFDAWLYRPTRRAPIGAFLVVPGLHFLGPADPRLDRLLSVLASSGFLTLSPFLPDFIALRADPTVIADAETAFEALWTRADRPAGCRPGVFSISFGSLPALRLAASPRWSERVGALVVFGGYADWTETIRFCLTGEIDGRPLPSRDALNQPVVFLNHIDQLARRPADAASLERAWRRYVDATWGHEEMKAPERYVPIARAIAAELGEDAELFLIGCGVQPGGLELFEQAVQNNADSRRFLDPRPHLHGIRCPVHLVHGRDDDVIPYTQAQRLADAMPPEVATHTYLTGWYGHSRRAGLLGSLRQLPEMVSEGWTMLRMVKAIVSAGTTFDP